MLKLQERPNKSHQEAAITRVSDRFWKDWELRMRNRYPRGIDLAKGTNSTKLDHAKVDSEKNTEYQKKYDQSDSENPWNRYLDFKHDEKLSYQRHLGFHERKFHPGQVLAARKKENVLQKLVKEPPKQSETK